VQTAKTRLHVHVRIVYVTVDDEVPFCHGPEE
jgi:hypothetical protein